MSIIRAEKLCLNYPVLGIGSRSLKKQMLGKATGGLISMGEKILEVNALQDVNFEIKDGERLGLIGHNGAGKSTLLKVLAGIYSPTSGVLSVSGRIVSTLNLAIGMEPEATGIENIMIRGLLLGMSKNEIKSKLDDIAEFTELGEYLSLPVRIYSSGMLTRLAYATVTAIEADIILMDEVIGTGDATFIEKAEKRLSEFMNRSKILVLASHGEEMIRKFCTKVLLLGHGRVIGFGEVDEMFAIYNQQVAVNAS